MSLTIGLDTREGIACVVAIDVTTLVDAAVGDTIRVAGGVVIFPVTIGDDIAPVTCTVLGGKFICSDGGVWVVRICAGNWV